MTELFVTPHAIERYQERVEDVPSIEVHRRLNTAIFQRAADFGAPYVKLRGGQRAVIDRGVVVTILPPHHFEGSLDRRRDPRRGPNATCARAIGGADD